MKVFLVLGFTVLMLASGALFLTGVQWLLTDQQYAPQQDAAASLATAYFVASFICMWLASKLAGAYDRREQASMAEWERQQAERVESWRGLRHD